MRKVLVTAAALTALIAAPALAADLPRPALKAPPPPPPPVYSWTGCYLAGGLGYGLWNQDISVPGVTAVTTTAGGRGWLGTVQVGCDYQLSGDWVIGAFGDWDFESLKGTPRLFGGAFNEKQTWAWGVGGRIGYLVMPQLLAYVGGGFTEAHFNSFEIFDLTTGASFGDHVPAHSYHGWFLSTGYEYAMRFLPGWFWKTEYRYSGFQSATLSAVDDTTGALIGSADVKKREQTIRSELVWRFNWGAPMRGAY